MNCLLRSFAISLFVTSCLACGKISNIELAGAIITETGTTITGWVTVAESKEPSEAGQTEAVRLTLASKDAPSIVRS